MKQFSTFEQREQSTMVCLGKMLNIDHLLYHAHDNNSVNDDIEDFERSFTGF